MEASTCHNMTLGTYTSVSIVTSKMGLYLTASIFLIIAARTPS